ncbi:hypothetical protein F442_05245 [Phytophthora nicotianae P10297]|uniref:Protein kinase domain-containing protein n=1 Tax=Phytophthora nicotianae P10297 TaxID=1317064 RepID=W2ZQ79_PHYNI|nr:hypothetical protein F442_05245 [Phytophthora nicotianae P10297]
MAKGLTYLHNHNPIVIHRDLKSQNILLDDRMNFGLFNFRDVGKTMSIFGSSLEWLLNDIMNGVAGGNLRPTVPDGTPARLARQLEDCWVKKQDQRPTFNELVPRLEAMIKSFAA